MTFAGRQLRLGAGLNIQFVEAQTMIVEHTVVLMSPLHLLIIGILLGVFVVLPIVVGLLIAWRIRSAKRTRPQAATDNEPITAEVVDEEERR
ncbi:MAG: hypothetical protein ACLQNE_37850 [Thermoguttaceae bacterium]